MLVAARNPLNIGAAARAMTNFGFGRLGVVNAYNIGFREARSAVGAAELLESAVEYLSVAEAVADCTLVVGTTAVRHRDVQHPVRQLENGGHLIRKRLATGRVALLFGSEKFGLSNKGLSHCDWLMRIPTHEQNISMNLGQSVAVCLYELVRDAKSARSPEKLKLAMAGELERITSTLLDVMRESGYLRRRPIADVEERMRRLIHRMNLPASDTVVWLGILRQIAWKLKTASAAKLK